jgi:hypothetical protein
MFDGGVRGIGEFGGWCCVRGRARGAEHDGLWLLLLSMIYGSTSVHRNVSHMDS